MDVKDYALLSDDVLDIENQKLENAKEEIKTEQRKIRDARSLKSAVKKVMLMTDTEKEALHQVISGAGAIASKSAVGTPGN